MGRRERRVGKTEKWDGGGDRCDVLSGMKQRDPRRPDVAERAGVAELEGTVPAGLIIVILPRSAAVE
jgi:hypothetical protein